MGDTTDDRIERLEATIRELAARTEVLEAENRALRRAPRPAPGTDTVAGGSMDRRRAIKAGLGLAAGAAAGATLLDATPAAATNGDPVKAGAAVGSTSETWISHTGTDTGFTVSSTSVGHAVQFYGYNGGALQLTSRHHHLALALDGQRGLPAGDAIFHQAGEIAADGYANLWYCTASGTPGTWCSLAGPTMSGAFYPKAAPVRVYDSRPSTSPATGPKTKLSGTRVIDLRANGGIDTAARAALVTVLLVNATAGNGNFTIWANGVAKPLANSLVWGGSTGRFTVQTFVSVDALGKVQVNASLATDIVIDVIGHYA